MLCPLAVVPDHVVLLRWSHPVVALPDATIVATPVGPFDTLVAGFVVAQLALTDGPADRVVFHNVAPRRDEPNARRANEGERFTVAEAPNGTLVVGPNSGHSLAFLHDQAPLTSDLKSTSVHATGTVPAVLDVFADWHRPGNKLVSGDYHGETVD